MKKNILNQFFILAIIVGLVSDLNIFAQSPITNNSVKQVKLSDFGSANVIGEHNAQAPMAPVVFLNQAANTVNGLFADASCALCGTGQQTVADNFAATIANATTGITQLVIWGGYYPEDIPNTTDNFTIILHADNAGQPGTVITTLAGLQATTRVQTGVILFGTHEYQFTFDFSASPIMVPSTGTYWIELYNNSVESGNFYWETGNLDATHGIAGSGWYTTTPGTLWNLDPATDLSAQINGDDNVTPCAVGAPSNPTPPDGTTGISNSGTTLTWINGAGTTQVEVWFGAGVQTKVYDGAVITSWPTGPLNYMTNYGWRIVDKSAICGTSGPSWTFQTIQNPAIIFSEPFNSLSCWTAIGPLGLTNWSISSTALAGGTSPELHLFYSPSFNGLSKLVSCNITTTAIGQVHNLELKHFCDWYADPAPFMGIGISYDNGATYTPIWEFQPVGGNVGPETIQTTFTPTAGTFQLVLYMNGDSFNIDNWYVDDINVSLPLPNDVGTYSIDMTFYNPGTVSPKATVKNFGTNTNTFNVQMQITGGYTSTKTVTSLAPGATQQVTFDNWNVSTIGVYTVDVCTQLGSDANTANDCKSKPVTITNWHFGSAMTGPEYLGGGAGYVSGAETATGYLFTIGGNTLSALNNECYKYNVSTDTWSPIASLPAGRVVLATAVVGDFLYAIGGYDVTSVVTNTVYKYDIAGNTWTSVANVPVALGWCKAVSYNNRIYLAGGTDGVSSVFSTVYVYNVATDSWTSATSMPGARFGGAFGITGNKLVYVAGADLSLIYADVFVGTIDGSDPTLITWTTMANRFPGTEGISNFGSCEGFTNARIPKTDPNNPTDNIPYPPGTMFKFDAAPWGSDAIIVAGGDPNASWIPANPNPCYVYKPGTDTWTAKENVPTPILGAALGTINIGNAWSLIVATGYTGSTITDATQILSETLGGATTFQLSVNVANGWNMVSVPGTNPAGMGVNTWWAFRDMGANVFKYLGGYTTVTTTVPGIGYWMKHTGARTYNTGDEWPAGGIQIVAHAPLAGASGWNLIGGYELSVTAANVTTIPAGQQSGPIYKYSGGYSVATTIDPGYGYWIKLLSAAQIIIPETLAKETKPVEWFPENWGKIVLTDATGVTYTLYAVSGDVDLSQYELPPAPIAGMFDIRFSSGRIAEDINSSVKTIDMSGVTYPVTVRAEGMDMRLMDETGRTVNVNLKSGEDVVISEATIQKLMVSGGESLPTVYALEQNYPNPFNPSTVIEFSLPEDVSNVKLSIYNALGEKVAELVNTGLTAGKYSYQWNAKNVATGLYIYELRTDKFVSVKKMLLLK